MPELLLELFSEEIPARMQARAADDLRRLMLEGLKAQGLAAGEAKAYVTPRRLALVVEDVPARSPDLSEERKGPRVNAPEQAIAGLWKVNAVVKGTSFPRFPEEAIHRIIYENWKQFVAFD